jgi:hypothetical protein
MPRYHPENNCDLFIENEIVENVENSECHRLRKKQLRNPVEWFRNPELPERHSFFCTWGIGETFDTNFGIKNMSAAISRLRKNVALPTDGTRGIWKINRTPPVGTKKLPLHTWSIKDWLGTSSKSKNGVKKGKKKGKKSKK